MLNSELQNFYLNMASKYKNMMLRYAYYITNDAHLTDDVYQAVLINLYKENILSKLILMSESEQAAYVSVAVKNCCYREMSLRRNEVLTDDIDKLSFAFLAAEDVCLKNFIYTEIYDMLMKLPEKYRVVLFYRYVRDASLEETSKILKLKPYSIKTRLARGRKMLGLIMENERKGDYRNDRKRAYQ